MARPMTGLYLDARIDECLMTLLLLRRLLPLALEYDGNAAGSRLDRRREAQVAWGLAEEPRGDR